MKFPTSSCVCLLLAACASTPDHFYTLTTIPAAPAAPAAASRPAIHAVLTLSVPPLVDRAEMVMNTADNGILILDHERWAVLLSEQVSQTLARDIESRRGDVLVGDRGFDRSASPAVTIKVDIVRMSVRRGGSASIEAHWRIVDPNTGMDEIGSERFEAALEGDDYASVARAYSQTLGALAGKLAGMLRPT